MRLVDNADPFPNFLMSRFEKVSSQCRKGIRAQERVSRLLDDVSTMQENFAINISRLVSSGITDIDVIVGGNRDGFHDVSRSLLFSLKKLIDYSTSISQFAEVLKALSLANLEASKRDTKRLRQIENEEITLRKQVESVGATFEKSKKQCEKSIAPLFEAGFESSKTKKQERLSSKVVPKVIEYFTAGDEANRSLSLYVQLIS